MLIRPKDIRAENDGDPSEALQLYVSCRTARHEPLWHGSAAHGRKHLESLRSHSQPAVKYDNHRWAGPLYDMASVDGPKKWGHWRLTMLGFH